MATDAEKDEFDRWTGEHICSIESVQKLQSAAEYFRQEGIYTTAKAVHDRLEQLAGSRGGSEPDSGEAAAEVTSLFTWQEECKQKEKAARNKDSIAQLQPPVRSSVKDTSKTPQAAVPAPAASTKGGKGTKAVPRSQDLTDQSLQDEEPLLGGEALKISSTSTSSSKASSMPGLARPKQQAQGQGTGAGLVQEVQLRGAQRTQELIRQNQRLPEADKAAVAEAERVKGNEFFRSGHTAEAVECYTLCIALQPNQLTAYSNRAEAYLRLQQWDYAITDCNSALQLMQQHETAGGLPQLPLRIKTLARRCRAHEGKKQYQEAVQDYETLQQLAPDAPQVKGLAAKARAALGLNKPPTRPPAAAAAAATAGRRVVPVVEVSDEEEEEEEETTSPASNLASQPQQQEQPSGPQAAPKQQQQQQATVAPQQSAAPAAPAQQPASTRRVAIPIVEESDESGSDDSDSDSADHQQQQPQVQQAGQAPANPARPQAVDSSATRADEAAAAPIVGSMPAVPAAPAAVARTEQPVADASSSSNASSSSSSSGSGGGSSGGSSDDEASDGSSSAVEEAVEEAVPPTYEQLFDTLWEDGKAAFQKGDYSQALDIYTRALQHCPDSARVLVNASLALLRLSRPDDAFDKASLAIGLQPDNSKAFHARHKAKEALGDYKGAVADLQKVIALEPPARRQLYTAELTALQARGQAVTQQAQAAAEAVRHASRTVAESCMIEEVGDEPEEEQQRVHDDLLARERMLVRRAQKLGEVANRCRADYEAQFAAAQAARREREQQRALRRQQQQRRQQRGGQGGGSAWGQKKQARQQRLARGGAAFGAVSPTPPAAAAGAPAGPPTPPHSQEGDATAAPGDTLLPFGAGVTAAAAAVAVAGTTAAGSTAAAPPAAGAAEDKSTETATGPSTPRSDSRFAPTPTSTPAAPLFVFGSPNNQQQQQQSQASDLADRLQQQQEEEADTAAQVEQHCDRGRALQLRGELDAAQQAYMEALSLDPDNIRVLLNLSKLALDKGDGQLALRCCDEVLAQQQGASRELPTTHLWKATLRRGLACELLGLFEESLDLLSTVKEWHTAAGEQPDAQLSADMVRVSHRIQDQKQQQQKAAAAQPADEAAVAAGAGAAYAAATAAEAVGSDSSSDSTDTDTVTDELVTSQQQQPDLTWDPAQPYPATAADGSSSDEDGWEMLESGDVRSGSASPAVSPSHLASGLSQRGLSAGGWSESPQYPGQRSMGDYLRGVHAEEAARQRAQQGSGGRDNVQEGMEDLLQAMELEELAEQAASLQQQQQQQAHAPKQQKQQQKQQQKHHDEIQSLMQKVKEAQAAAEKNKQHKLLATAADREQGNAAFKAGQYQAALKHYNAALQAEPQDVRVYSNRAQVYLKLKRPAKVEEDCSTALELFQQQGPARVAASHYDGDASAARQLREKLLYRRALARKDLGKFKEALADLKYLRLGSTACDPSVAKLQAELADAYKQQLQRLVHASTQHEAEPEDTPAAAAAAGAAGEGAAPVVRLHRIVIEETDGSDSEEEEEKEEATAAGRDREGRAAASKQGPGAPGGGAAPRKGQAAPAPAPGAAAAAAAAAISMAAKQRVLTEPKTAVQFLTTAKSLLSPAAGAKGAAAEAQQLGEYVKLLPASQYGSVFKAGLDARDMPLLLRGLHEVGTRQGELAFAEQGLAALSRVQRFGIVYSMLDRGSKGLVREVVEQLEAGGRDVGQLRRSYRL